MGRAAAAVVVAFVAGIGVGFALRGCGAGTVPPPDDVAPRTRHEVPDAVRPPRPPRARVPDPPPDPAAAAPDPAGARPGAADVREIPLSGTPDGFEEVTVEVVDSAGAPVGDATVHALPAGAPGDDDDDRVPNATTGLDGRCRLQLPAPGAYDLGARSSYSFGRFDDVRLPGAPAVRIRLSRTAVATFVLDPDRPPTGDVAYSVSAVPDPRRHVYPGRGDLPCVDSLGGGIGAAHPRRELVLAPIAYEVGLAKLAIVPGVTPPPVPAVEFEPRVFTPPATVVVRAADPDARTLDVRLTFVLPDGAAQFDRRYAYRLEFDDAVAEGTARFDWEDARERSVVRKQRTSLRTGTLRWSGPDLVPGGAQWDADRSLRIEGRIDVRADRPDESVRLFVDLPEADAPDDGLVAVYVEDPEDRDSLDRARCEVGREVDLGPTGTRDPWLLVDVDRGAGPLDRKVAGPVRGRAGSVVRVTPRRGGYVVFAPADAPPPGAGEPVVSRADGAPFPYAQYGDDSHARRAAVAPGARLGPFEPGTVTLDVSVGARLWGRYAVTVREGQWTTFRPRPFR